MLDRAYDQALSSLETKLNTIVVREPVDGNENPPASLQVARPRNGIDGGDPEVAPHGPSTI
jgi:hypothetical protein